MGVTGCGKTTVGKLLADQLGWEFYDADDFHPPQNVEKMRSGIPLNDEDRIPWLEALANLIHQTGPECGFVLACSALKHDYRKLLRVGLKPVQFVYLKGTSDLIRERLEARRGHYMNPKLLRSQFDTLEEPKDALYVDIAPEPEEIVASIRSGLELT